MAAANAAGRMVGACFEGDLEAVRELLGEDPSLSRTRFDELESTPLHVSAHRGHGGIVALLLEHGADPNAREGCSGTTPLHWAAESGQVGVAEELLARGAALDARDDWHALPPLDWAVFVVHAPHLHADRLAVRALLAQRGARPSIFSAIAIGDADELRRLVARDRSALEARLGPVDGEATPLSFAIERGAAPMAALLLELGADPGACSERGLSPRALAHLAKDDASAALLDARVPVPDLSFLVVSGQYEAARNRLQQSPSLLASGGAYEGLLHSSVLHGLADQTRFLLEVGADPRARQRCLGVDEWLCDLPPLFLAASKGCATVAQHLLAHGADPNERGMRSDATPLHVAALRGYRGDIQLLLASGADPRARDGHRGATPADWARESGRAEIAALLA